VVALSATRRNPLFILLLGAALAHIAAFIGTGLLRSVYPYPIDGLEPGALQQVRRVLSGEPLYVAPTLAYVPQIYGPLLFYLAAPLAALTGSAQFALRATSLLASLGSIAVLVGLVRLETRSLAAGLFAGALLASCNQLVDGTMDIGRTDAVSLFFVLASVLSVRQAALAPEAKLRFALLGGCMGACAVLAKQSVAPVIVALGIVLAVLRWRMLVGFGLGFVVTGLAGAGALLAHSGAWAIYYLWHLPSLHQILPHLMWRFWGDVLGRFAPAILIGPFFLVGCWVKRNRPALLFYSVVPLSMIVVAWVTQATVRGGRNVELPAYAAIALLAGLGLAEAIVWIGAQTPARRTARAYLLAAAVGQLAVLIYNPRFQVPYRSDQWAGDRLTATLATLPGPIFAPGYQGFVRDAPGALAPDMAAVVELEGEQWRPSTPEGEGWENDLGAAIRARQFTYLIVDPDSDGFIVPQLADAYGYVHVGSLFPTEDVYWAWRTGWAPRVEVYARPD